MNKDYKELKSKPKINAEDNKKPYKKPYKKPTQPKEEKFDVEKWLRQHKNVEYPKRGKKNTLDKDRRKR